ncbi:MAG: hypothetical protein EBU31_08885, partial [Proteobacteria bacterium]|nr:hypothetical protein [Pseudomonadota bacterium]
KSESASTSFQLPAWFPAAACGVALGAVAIALVLWVPKLFDQVHTAALASPIRVVLRDQPEWLPKDDRIAIERGVIKSLGASPFDRDGLVSAREAVARCGWYTNVAQVRRSDVDEVIVDGTWAIPFALVCDAAGEHLVDTRGRILPRNYPAGRGPKLLRISGVAMPMPAAYGSVWPGDEVAAALAMASLVADRPWRAQIAAVDVSGWAKDGLLRMRTDRGREIVWGRAPGKESATEVPAIQKLAAMQMAFDRSGRIEGGAPNAIDLRGDLTVTR